MATSRRVRRVQAEAMRILGDVVTKEIKDDRIADALVSVSRTKVSPDLAIMHVWFSIVGDERTQRGLLSVLERARPFLRRKLGEGLQLRVVPELKLHLDEGPNNAARVDELLERIEDERDARARVRAEEEAPGEGVDTDDADGRASGDDEDPGEGAAGEPAPRE